MIRLIVRTLVAVAANAIGLLIAASVLDDMHVDAGGFVLALIIFTIAFAVLTPFFAVQLRRVGHGAMFATPLVATLVSLILADLLSDGFSISGVATWVEAALIVWLASLVAVFILPFLGLKKYMEDRPA